MKLFRVATCWLLLLNFSNAAWATDAERIEALQWLGKIAKSARDLNYTGTFVYQQGEKVETSRITHFVDRSGEYEKLQTLDGPRREIIRMNDQIYCYDHDSRVLRRERQTGRRNFPALLPETLSQVTDNYEVRIGGQERIAGFDTQIIFLEPRDGFRYGHRLWADVSSGLLLRAKRFNERKDVVEQFTFTQLSIGMPTSRELTRPNPDMGPSWRTDIISSEPGPQGQTAWVVQSFPPGFRKIVEMRRIRDGAPGVVTHMVFSDGLASVSVFIEPLNLKKKSMEGLVRHGAVNILFRPLADQMITVVGEAPPSTILQIGNSVIQQGR